MNSMQIPAAIQPPRYASLHIHIAHGCAITRTGVAAVLDKVPEWHVTCSDQGQAVSASRAAAIVITDYNDGLLAAAAQAGAGSANPPRIVVLSEHTKEGDVRRAIEGGVQGYLLYGSSTDDLLACVRSVQLGSSYLSPGATRSVINSLNRATLTPRENDVLQALATGASDKLIARRLDIGIGTVKSHMKNLMTKLDASARTHVVVVALRRGLVDNPAM